MKRRNQKNIMDKNGGLNQKNIFHNVHIIDPNKKKKHLFECVKGHKIVIENLTTFVAFWNGIKRMVCPKCLFDWAEDKEIKDMGEYLVEETERNEHDKE